MTLLLGDWRSVLPDQEVDALISDPPYGERTHAAHDAGVERAERPEYSDTQTSRRRLQYACWSPEDVRAFVDHWSPRTSGWMAIMSCSDLAPVYRAAFEAAGRVAFAPVACVIRGMSVRLSGDGPSNWTIYLNVARPVGLIDGARNGAYVVPREPGYIGGKPRRLMDAIVRDYSRPGDLVCDPCAGLATTMLSARSLGRRPIGAEVDPETHAAAIARLARDAGQGDLFSGVAV